MVKYIGIPLSKVKIKKGIFRNISIDELKTGEQIIVLQKKGPIPMVYMEPPVFWNVVRVWAK